MYEDLIVDDCTDSLVSSIGINEEVYYIGEPPEKCLSCGCPHMNGVEILGACDHVLFWECEGCDKLYLACDRAHAELQLGQVVGCWTVPQAWGWKDKSQFN
jgi:hypothetical protein